MPKPQHILKLNNIVLEIVIQRIHVAQTDRQMDSKGNCPGHKVMYFYANYEVPNFYCF